MAEKLTSGCMSRSCITADQRLGLRPAGEAKLTLAPDAATPTARPMRCVKSAQPTHRFDEMAAIEDAI